MKVYAYIYGNTGNIEDDVEWTFSLDYVLVKGMKIKSEDVVYITIDSIHNTSTDVLEVILQPVIKIR